MVGGMSSILRELEQVQDQLGSLTKDAQAEKTALLGRQEELRTRAARLADQIDIDCSTQDLLAQLASLRRQRDALSGNAPRPLSSLPGTLASKAAHPMAWRGIVEIRNPKPDCPASTKESTGSSRCCQIVGSI